MPWRGRTVRLAARTYSKLETVGEWINETNPRAVVECTALDLNIGGDRLGKFIDGLPRDMPLYWVQSVGLGAGTVILKDDNPYLRIDDLTDELIEAELGVLKNTITLLKALLPRFRKQKETRVCIVTSMSAVRSVVSGSMHNAAKGAISRFTNAAMIELDEEKIFITDIRPGAVDTGMYDAEVVQKTICMIAGKYGYDWREKSGGARLMPPSAVGKIVASVLASEAHITSVNMVARGQFPHEGS